MSLDPLGHAVAPGDPAAVRAVAADLQRRAASLRDEAGRLAALPCRAWEGAAAASFSALVLTLPDDLRRSAQASAEVAGALASYAAVLASAQAALPRLRRRAEEAAGRLARASAAPADPLGPVGRLGPLTLAAAIDPAAAATVDPAAAAAARDRAAAQEELRDLRREAERLAGAVADAGRAAARAVDGAAGLLPDPPPLLDRALSAVAAVTGPGRERVGVFAAAHADELETASQVLAVVGAAAGLAAVVCPALGVVSVGSRAAQVALGAARGAAVAARAGGAARAVGLHGVVSGMTAGNAATGSAFASLAVNGARAAGPDLTVRGLWPDALAVGTLGASRVLTAPVRLPAALGRSGPGAAVQRAADRLGHWTVAGARAADTALPPRAGVTRPGTWPLVPAGPSAPSVWSASTAFGPNEMVMRSVRLTVETPAFLVGAAGAAAAGRALAEGRGRTRPAGPGPASGHGRPPGPRVPGSA